MYSVAARIWNEIAAKEKLRTQWARRMFKLDQEEMNEALETESDKMKAQGITSAAVRLGYLTVKPLLLENVAISQYIMDTDRLDLRNALPDICTVYEAVILASMDHPLTEEEERQLAELLQADFPDSDDEENPVIACIPLDPDKSILQESPLVFSTKKPFILIEPSEPYLHSPRPGNSEKKKSSATKGRIMSFDVSVPREAFDDALKQVKKANKGKKPFDFILNFDGVSLSLVTPMANFPVPATGIASVKICLPGQVMIRMQGTFPAVESLRFLLNGSSLKIDRLSMPCSVI